MDYLRAGYRLVALILTQIIFILLGIVLLVIFSGSQRRHWHYVTVFIRHWAKWCCFILNIRVKVAGEGMPDDGALIVANHVGLSDIFALGSCFKAFFVSKQDVQGWPLVGWMVRLGGTIFVERSKRHQVPEIIALIAERLKKGSSVLIFPEGGITDGTRVASFKSSTFEAAVISRAPVVPVAIRYMDDSKPSVAYWGGTTFLNHIVGLMKNSRLDVTLTILPSISLETDRRIIAERCQLMISKNI